jgi:hypothetical protein
LAGVLRVIVKDRLAVADGTVTGLKVTPGLLKRDGRTAGEGVRLPKESSAATTTPDPSPA